MVFKYRPHTSEVLQKQILKKVYDIHHSSQYVLTKDII